MSTIEAPELNVKQPGESFLYAYEFNNALLDGELPTSIDAVAATSPGDSAAALTFADQEIADTQVQVRISGGTHGYTYRTSCTITTNLGNTYSLDARLRVDDGE